MDTATPRCRVYEMVGEEFYFTGKNSNSILPPFTIRENGIILQNRGLIPMRIWPMNLPAP
jgi:hypothetical protein